MVRSAFVLFFWWLILKLILTCSVFADFTTRLYSTFLSRFVSATNGMAGQEAMGQFVKITVETKVEPIAENPKGVRLF